MRSSVVLPEPEGPSSATSAPEGMDSDTGFSAVAVPNSLAIEPRMLLLDEPFGALDAKVRKELRQGLRDIHDETGLTTIFVTHDQDEAMELADFVAIMSMGRIEQVGRPQDIRARPATQFVRDFIAA